MKTCPRCDKEIMRHWKYCNQCGRGCVLLDMDREYMRTLSHKSLLDAEHRLKMTQAALDIVVHENNELKDFLEEKQDAINFLARLRAEEFYKLLIKYRV